MQNPCVGIRSDHGRQAGKTDIPEGILLKPLTSASDPALIMKRFFRIYLIITLIILTFFNENQAQADNDYVLKTVVIDAGHGGKDPGAVCKNGKEKDITLSIALKLGKYIEKNFPDVKVIYTRNTDEFIELHRRATTANTNNADLFISIHANSSKKSDPYGSETYVMGLNKTAGNLAVAKTENEVILKEDDYSNQYEGFDPNSPEAYIIFSLYQNAFIEQSLNLASKIQDQFRVRVGQLDRGVKQAGFLVLWKTTMPSILIEVGFISNPKESAFILSEEGQIYLSSAIFRAFRDYKNEMEGKGLVKPLPHDDQQIPDINNPLQKDTSSALIQNDSLKNNISAHSDHPLTNPDTIAGKNEVPVLLYTSIVFKVQIATSDKQLKTVPENFKGLKGVEELKDGNKFKYLVGNCRYYEEVLKLQNEVRKNYPDAFTVAYKDGKKIPVIDAVKELKKQ
jgi:N-acetylmuramoyl-L-alanine amidase